MSGPAFDTWWAARPINDRLSFFHHDRETYTREGWDAGTFSERARLREKVEAMRNEALARSVEHERVDKSAVAKWRLVGSQLSEVLALLAEPGE